MALKDVERLAKEHTFDDLKWISGNDVVVKQWVRFSCELKCSTYGTKPICPPHVPSIPKCERFFEEYDHIMIIRIHKKAHHRDDDKTVFKALDENVMALEKRLFFKGYYKVMALPATICTRCEVCGITPESCNHKVLARPTPEALGVDVFETVRRIGYPIDVLRDYNQIMNRYVFMLVA